MSSNAELEKRALEDPHIIAIFRDELVSIPKIDPSVLGYSTPLNSAAEGLTFAFDAPYIIDDFGTRHVERRKWRLALPDNVDAYIRHNSLRRNVMFGLMNYSTLFEPSENRYKGQDLAEAQRLFAHVSKMGLSDGYDELPLEGKIREVRVMRKVVFEYAQFLSTQTPNGT